MINILSKALQIQTTSDVNEENMPKLHALIEKSFPLVHKHMEKTVVGHSLVYKLNGQGNPIMFCGHMDVVAADASAWDLDPYAGIIDEKYIWGRGAIDCKNTVIGLLCAMESLLSEGFMPTRTIYLAFGHDEEIGGPNGATKITKMFLDQGVRMDMVLDEGGHISTEFLDDGKNYATIALAEKNILRIKLSAPDKGGHAAYISSKTALYRISQAIMAIEENPMPVKIIPLIQKYIDTLTPIYPHLVENYGEQAKNNPFVRTTIAPTMIEASKAPNILPSNPSFVCDIRMLPTQTVDEVISHVKNLVKDFNINIDILSEPQGEGRATDFNSDFYKAVENMIKEKFDDAIVVPALMAGGTDARHYEAISDVVLRFMPVLMDSATHKTLHAANERIEIQSFNRAVDFYKTFMKKHG